MLLNICKDRLHLLGNLCQLLVKMFPDFKQSLLYFSLCPLPLVLSLDTTEKSQEAPSSLHLPFRYVYTFIRYMLPQPHSRLSQLAQPFLTEVMLQSLHHPPGSLLDYFQYVFCHVQNYTLA